MNALAPEIDHKPALVKTGGVQPARENTWRIVPLTRELLLMALACERERDLIQVDVETMVRRVSEHPGLSFAMIEGGYLIAAGGLVLNWPGCGDGWLIVTGFARRRHLAAATRFSRRKLDQVQRDPRFKRIELRMRARERWHPSFARALGFTDPPQLLEAWGPDGADYMLYARISRSVT